MARRLTVRTRCPLCGERVEEILDGILKKNSHHKNAEFVVTRLHLVGMK